MGVDFPAFDGPFLALVVTVVVAGVARGMSGFGSGMIIAPVAAAIYGPQVAVPMVAILETFPTIPITIPALPLARWREVLPVTVGMAVFLPAGAYVLSQSDADLLRWIICIAILACAAVLWTGWRYRGPRGLPISFGVGSVAGLLTSAPKENDHFETPGRRWPDMSQLAGLTPPAVPGALGVCPGNAVVPPDSSGGHGASTNLR